MPYSGGSIFSEETKTIFAAQMVNFPIIGGVSGHLLGATLVAILLDLYAAVLICCSHNPVLFGWNYGT